MLLGEYEHTVDDKNRVTLPAKFRQALAEGVVLTRGLEGCVYAFARGDWERLVETHLAGLNPLSPDSRRMQRLFFAGAHEAELDKQGRVMLPGSLIEHGKLGRDVVIAGIHDHLEIWNRDTWRAHLKEIEGSAEDVAERLAANRS